MFHVNDLCRLVTDLRSRLLTLGLILAGAATPLIVRGAATAASPANVDWPAYLGDKERSHYSPLQEINRSNVAQLKVAWTYDTGDKGEYQANNLIVAGVLYTASPARKVIAATRPGILAE
jgi:quinoprotein glucose dehydrogenase